MDSLPDAEPLCDYLAEYGAGDKPAIHSRPAWFRAERGRQQATGMWRTS